MDRPSDETSANARRGTAAASAAVALWGLGNVLVTYIRLPGNSIAFYRLALGAIVYWAVLRATGGHLTRRIVRLAIPGGVAFGLDMSLFFVSLKHTSIADATVITALQPALVFLVAGRLFAERVSVRMVVLIGVAVAGVGVAIVGSSPTAGRTLFGDIAASASLVAWSYYFVAAKQARRDLTALEFQVGVSLVATAVVAPFAFARPADLALPDAATLGWILLMVCVPGGGHLLMNWAHRYCSITLTSTLTLGIPVVGIAAAAVILGQPVTGIQVVGICVALLALALIVRRPPPAVMVAGAVDPVGPAGTAD